MGGSVSTTGRHKATRETGQHRVYEEEKSARLGATHHSPNDRCLSFHACKEAQAQFCWNTPHWCSQPLLLPWLDPAAPRSPASTPSTPAHQLQAPPGDYDPHLAANSCHSNSGLLRGHRRCMSCTSQASCSPANYASFLAGTAPGQHQQSKFVYITLASPVCATEAQPTPLVGPCF